MITRQYARISVDIKVNCDGEIKSIAKDISEGGIRIITQGDFRERSYILLHFLVTPQLFIKTHGKVIWKKTLPNGFHEMGLQFWGLNEADQAKIRSFVKSQFDTDSAEAV